MGERHVVCLLHSSHRASFGMGGSGREGCEYGRDRCTVVSTVGSAFFTTPLRPTAVGVEAVGEIGRHIDGVCV